MYWIVAPHLPWACRCDEMEGPPYPPESYATLDEAIDRLPILFDEVANKCFHALMLQMEEPKLKKAISVEIMLADSVIAGKPKVVSKKKIKHEFKRFPSVPIVGQIKFWNSDHGSISCLVQGEKEIQAWLQSPEAKELSGIVKSIGASAIIHGGIEVK